MQTRLGREPSSQVDKAEFRMFLCKGARQSPAQSLKELKLKKKLHSKTMGEFGWILQQSFWRNRLLHSNWKWGIYPPRPKAIHQGPTPGPIFDLQWSGIAAQCSQYYKHIHNFHQLDVFQWLCHEKHSQSQYTPQMLLDLRCHPQEFSFPKIV